MSRTTNPLECLAAALHHAAWVALPDVVYESRDLSATKKWTSAQHWDAAQKEARGEVVHPRVMRRRRPAADECTIIAMFAQTWGSTALGFGGIGGAAITSAYTIVVSGPCGQFAVYWHGRFAYLVNPREQTDEQRMAWSQDLSHSRTVNRKEAVARYGAQLPDSAVED